MCLWVVVFSESDVRIIDRSHAHEHAGKVIYPAGIATDFQ